MDPCGTPGNRGQSNGDGVTHEERLLRNMCWILPKRGRKAPLNVCVVVGRREAKGNTGKGKERERLGKKKKKNPQKAGEKLSTQPYFQ